MRLPSSVLLSPAVVCALLALAIAGVGNAQPRDMPPRGPGMGGMMPDRYAGIGAIVRPETDPATGRQSIKVASVVPGGSAEQAGLRAGDVIIALDDEPVESLPLNQVMRKIRGDEASQLRVTVKREGIAEPIELRLTRARVDPGDLPRPGLGEHIGQMMPTRPAPTPVMVVHDGHIFVLIGDVLYKVNAETMQQVGAVRLVPPGPEL